MGIEKIKKIVVAHGKWLQGVGGGRADLSWADLSRADLSGTNLFRADLFGADLSGTNLSGANLFGADLSGANLSGAKLSRADLSGADMSGADLSRANLSGAKLSRANLSGANLYRANMYRTCLAETNFPNADCRQFERLNGGYAIGYRTRRSGHIDQYRDGRIYAADWFSTCKTVCHPGLYLWPTRQHAINYSGHVEIIRVKTRAVDVHRAGDKWRCRWFEVLGEVS